MKKTFFIFLGLLLLGIALLCVGVEAGGITYNAATKEITVWGGTVATPYHFSDIYNASVTGGWGVVRKFPGDWTGYLFDARILFGSGNSTGTNFTDTYKTIIFNASCITANSQRAMGFHNHTIITLGTVLNWNDKITAGGCSFIYLNNARTYLRVIGGMFTGGLLPKDVNISIYSCRFQKVKPTAVQRYGSLYGITQGRVWNCEMDNVGLEYVNISFYHTSITNFYDGAAVSWSFGDYEAPWITNTGFYFYFYQSRQSTITNLYGRGHSDANSLWAAAISVDNYLIDADLDAWLIYWNGVSTGKIWRQYKMDVTVMNNTGDLLDNADVNIYNKSGSLVYSGTTTSGVIPTQLLNFGYYYYAGGNTPLLSNPHTIRINKSGYQNYTKIFNITAPLNWTVALQNATSTGFSDTSFALGISAGMRLPKNNLFIVGISGGLMFGFITGFIVIARLKNKKEEETGGGKD